MSLCLFYRILRQLKCAVVCKQRCFMKDNLRIYGVKDSCIKYLGQYQEHLFLININNMIPVSNGQLVELISMRKKIRIINSFCRLKVGKSINKNVG